jgi:DNA-directed RNA polymerase specialized sigma24 family protein
VSLEVVCTGFSGLVRVVRLMGSSTSHIGLTVETVGPRPAMARVTGNDFERFYEQEYGPIVCLLVGMTGRWPLAEELAQEALLSAYRQWPRVQRLDRPDLWLRRVAINRAVSTRRRLVAELAALARVRAGPVPHDRVAFDEIGEVLGCSGETARTHFRRARERLGTLLRTEDDDDA